MLTEFREIKTQKPKMLGESEEYVAAPYRRRLVGFSSPEEPKGGGRSGTTRGILASTGVLFIQSPPVGREGGGDIVMGNGRVARGGKGGEGGAGRLGEEG